MFYSVKDNRKFQTGVLYQIWGPILIYEINAPSPKDHSKFFHHPASDVTVVQKKERFLKDKRCIIQKQNKDDMCCARAIVTAKAKIDGHEHQFRLVVVHWSVGSSA
jgi:hypothetical protein